jgi:hypothetical protein
MKCEKRKSFFSLFLQLPNSIKRFLNSTNKCVYKFINSLRARDEVSGFGFSRRGSQEMVIVDYKTHIAYISIIQSFLWGRFLGSHQESRDSLNLINRKFRVAREI